MADRHSTECRTPASHEHLIAQSWARCQALGLVPEQPPRFTLRDTSLGAVTRYFLQATEQRVLPYYEHILGGSQSLLMLADAHGRLLRTWGAERFGAAHSQGLLPGADWSEANAGTNALGTALACGQALHVEADEHFLKANRYLSASAAPIFDARRRIVGALQVASDSYLPPSHTLGTVKMMSQAVENQLILEHFDTGHYRLALHTTANNFDSPWAGLLVMDTRGQVLAANRRADALLGSDPSGRHIEQVFGRSLAQLEQAGETFALAAPGRSRLHCQLQRPVASVASHAQAATQAVQADPLLTKGLRLLERNIPLLIQGETGTGKDVLARNLHQHSSRAGQPFVAVNCAAIPLELVESELFGYERGAFTGANQKGNPGLVRKADKGILFLDEIGDMPLVTQARLLRVLQERCIQPLGSGEPIPVDIRVISATHQDLPARIREGTFREDLYYRLAGFTLNVRPLRERADTQALILALWHEYRTAEQTGGISDAAMALLLAYPWPGNVRQLACALQVALALVDDEPIGPEHLPEALLPGAVPPALAMPANDIGALLAATDGNISQMARRMGVSRNTVYKRLRAMNGPTAVP